jgi:hypothetical protein
MRWLAAALTVRPVWITASTNASLPLKSTSLKCFSASRRRFSLPLLRGGAEVIRVDCKLLPLHVVMDILPAPTMSVPIGAVAKLFRRMLN